MTYFSNHSGERQIVDQVHAGLPIAPAEAAADAFGRLRVSPPETLFSSSLLWDKSTLFWDETITDNSGNATSTHSVADAAVSMYVEATDSVVRQTRMRFGYQPGRSQLVLMTGILGTGGTGVTGRIGLFDPNDGVFFQVSGTTISVGERKATSDTTVAQASWNLDPLDGTGPSGVTIDFSKAQIFVVDMEWLGVGRLRYGIGWNGGIIYCHETTHTNTLTAVYMSTPNLPLRYEVASAAGGASVTMKQICSSITSEGGNQDLGYDAYKGTAGTHINADTADTLYPVVGVRLSTAATDAIVSIQSISAINEQTGDFEWKLVVNPSTVAGTPSWSTGSPVQWAVGSSAITVPSSATFDAELAGAFVKTGKEGVAADLAKDVVLRPGVKLDGTRDQFWLAVRPLASNADVQGSMTVRVAQ